MKIRNGFVSNSSTSSFALFGVKLNSVSKLYQEITSKPSMIKKDDEEDDEYFEKLEEMVEAIQENLLEKKSLLSLTQTDGYEYLSDNSYVLGVDLGSSILVENPIGILLKAKEEMEALLGEKIKLGFHCGTITDC